MNSTTSAIIRGVFLIESVTILQVIPGFLPWSNWRTGASPFDASLDIFNGEHRMTNLAGSGGCIPETPFASYITKCEMPPPPFMPF